MKPARNSIIGYSYQKIMAFLLLAKMDVERLIGKIEIEADVNHQFDDLVVYTDQGKIYCQMKDFQGIKLSDIKFIGTDIVIKDKKHKLSDGTNILFIKDIDLEPNNEILNFQSHMINGVHIISISREEARSQITTLYEIDFIRMSIMENYFERKFDERVLSILLEELPPIKIFSTQLMDQTIDIQKLELKTTSLLMIEGKPGVGKSHLVNQLENQDNKLLYRFWISNQDTDYRERLEYKNFIADLIKSIFRNYVNKTEEEIIDKLLERNLTLVIDGLDHVENYNLCELELFINFFNKVAERSKVIILSRPLKTQLEWEKIKLQNWNFEQTYKYLNIQFHISSYNIIEEIYKITQGYPIIVNFIGNYYLNHKQLPMIEELGDLNDFYKSITKNLSVRSALSVFLSSNSYFMYSEFDHLLDGIASAMIKDFISDHPYLFEIKLNRISLIHDSLNTFLRSDIKYHDSHSRMITEKVYKSILSGEKRYISRFSYFNLSEEQNKEVINHYADINFFSKWIKGCIDIEAVQTFYYQLRKSLENLNPSSLNVYQYYDFALIQNILSRDHISNLHGFLYVYTNSLIENGYSEEDITSSGYLFSMLYFLKEGDFKPLETVASDGLYDTESFYESLILDINQEVEYFKISEVPLDLEESVNYINDENTELSAKSTIQDISMSIYIHGTDIREFQQWKSVVKNLVDKQDEESAITFFGNVLTNVNMSEFWARSIVKHIIYKLKSLGITKSNNEFLNMSFPEFINENSEAGSYNLQSLILDYLRLALKTRNEVDINAIYKYFICYYERKDYSVINIDRALITFREYECISLSESVEIINLFQQKSEKGIRHLLNSYIQKLSVEDFIIFIQEFSIKNFNIDLFTLPSSFINVVPESIVVEAFFEMLRRHSYSKKIDFFHVNNLLSSIYSEKVFDALLYHNFIISVDESVKLDRTIAELYGDIIEFSVSRSYGEHKNRSEENLESKIIMENDIEYAKDLNLAPIEIAKYTDGNYSSFSSLRLYENHNTKDLTEQSTAILHAAITSRIKTINQFSNLFFLVGNVPDFLVNYIDEEVSEQILFESFINFIKLSYIDKES
ncbi:hypothetical protein ACFOU0_02820 [Salinicoccus sesuvii]|uniref:NACHT domain-containing protein n=1 Tax=Salinicoccus sesuvii TaxID=868281 RepID=A0ABV7N375_9STAP